MAKKHDSPIAKTVKGAGRHFLSTKEGAGLTAAGRAAYNRKNKANLKPPAPHPKNEAEAGRRRSFCARMKGVVAKAKGDAPRAKASLRRWNCK